MESIERLSERLDNLQAVVPMLEALRLVALGSWQTAKQRGANVGRYAIELSQMREHLSDYLPALNQVEERAAQPHVVLLIGAERGLIGRYLEQLLAYFKEQTADLHPPYQVVMLGSRLERLAERAGVTAERYRPLPTSGLPPWELAVELADGWWQAYQAGSLRGVSIFQQTTRGMQPAQPLRTNLLPFESATAGEQAALWPPPIIETEPQGLAAKVVQLQLRNATYAALLRATEAEQLTRYQLLEAAVQNAESLQEELMTQRRMAQQEAITREMQELVVGAGMLGDG